MSKIAAIVPMRHSSERVPGKNYRDFAGVPLYHRVIKSLLGCAAIDTVVIDTDSTFIHEDAAQNFPEVKLLQRPESPEGRNCTDERRAAKCRQPN